MYRSHSVNEMSAQTAHLQTTAHKICHEKEQKASASYTQSVIYRAFNRELPLTIIINNNDVVNCGENFN